MRKINRLIILFICLLSLNLYGQSDKETDDCMKTLGKSFITDGQDHQLLIKTNKATKVFAVFYPKFTYRLVVCCNDKKIPIELKLNDKNGNVYFSNLNMNYIREWNFQFSSITNGIIELKLGINEEKEETVRLIIGYQPIDK